MNICVNELFQTSSSGSWRPFQYDRIQTELAGLLKTLCWTILWSQLFQDSYLQACGMLLMMFILMKTWSSNLIFSMTSMTRTERTSLEWEFPLCKICSTESGRQPPQVAVFSLFSFIFFPFCNFFISAPSSFFFSLFVIFFSIPAAPESNTLSADSFAFILVYGFVLVALVIYVGLRLARRRCRHFGAFGEPWNWLDLKYLGGALAKWPMVRTVAHFHWQILDWLQTSCQVCSWLPNWNDLFCILCFCIFCIFAFLHFCIFVFLYFCIFVFLYFCILYFIIFLAFLYFCIFVLLYFCIFVFFQFAFFQTFRLKFDRSTGVVLFMVTSVVKQKLLLGNRATPRFS